MPGLSMLQSEIIVEVQESLEGGFEAKALSHSIYTEAETLEELKKKKKLQDAARYHFEEKDRPSLIRRVAHPSPIFFLTACHGWMIPLQCVNAEGLA